MQKELNYFIAAMQDAVRSAEKSHRVVHTRFLDPFHRMKADEVFQKSLNIRFSWSGGYADAERQLAVIAPDYFSDEEMEEPVSIIQVSWDNRYYRLDHRDLLGSLLGMGIVRENIGDIIVEDGSATIFILEEISTYILSNLSTVGRASVQVAQIGKDEFKPVPAKYKETKTTVASLRVDAILSAGLGVSRANAVSIIAAGAVRLNWVDVLKADLLVKEGDMLSVKGKGRMKVHHISGVTKKGRTGVIIHRYI